MAGRKNGRSDRVAVIDIGSNSVRLVVYDALDRTPFPLFNEKAMCGLGRGGSGRLPPDAAAEAIAALRRYRHLIGAMGVGLVEAFATEAVRAASDGAAFLARAEEALEQPITALSGDEEAFFAAQGVRASFHRPRGLVGDLGGGSLDVAMIDEDGVGARASLPFGSLRLQAASGGDPSAAKAIVKAAFDGLDWSRSAAKSGSLYAVGGGWRAIGRAHLEAVDAAIKIVDHHAIPTDAAIAFCARLRRMDADALGELRGAPKKRLPTLPFAAAALEAALEASRPDALRFSAAGVREGRLAAHMAPDEARRDPLIAGAERFGAEANRDPAFGAAMIGWTDALFPRERPSERRLRCAACHVADIAWRDHPSGRAVQAFHRLINFPFMGVDHAERAFLGLALWVRHGRAVDADAVARETASMPSERRAGAEALGLAMRLGFRVSAGVADLLAARRLRVGQGVLVFEEPLGGQTAKVDNLKRALGELALALGLRDVEIARL